MDKQLTQADYDIMGFGQELPENYNRARLFNFAKLDEHRRQIVIYKELMDIKDLLFKNRNGNSCNNSNDSRNGGND